MDYDTFLQEFYRLERFGIKLGLDVITDLLHRVGDPHRRFPAVHVTGTNGKGSVCAFVSSVLREAGYRVGLYTSPHLIRFNERIRVDGQEIRDEDVVRLYRELKPHMVAIAAENPVHHPTFFEVATALAFSHFAAERIDIGVVEVGMGGRYDATNVLDPAVSVVTRVGLEHAEHLGRTVRRIAREKSGIIKNGVPAVTVDQDALPEIEARCRLTGSALAVVGRDVRFRRFSRGWQGQRVCLEDGGSLEVEIPLLGPHQAENAALAYAAVSALQSRDWKITETAVKDGFRKARWPARLDVVRREPTVIVDGAHNPPAAQALAGALSELLEGQKVTLLLGVMADKDLDGMARALVPLADRLVAVRSRVDRAASPDQVVSAFRAAAKAAGLPDPAAEVIPNVRDAVLRVLDQADPSETLLITGSIYVAGEALEALGDAR